MPERRDGAVAGLEDLPLPAMLSAALVAFTIECDNEVERRFADLSHGGMISLAAWLNAMQYLLNGPVSVRDICDQTHTSHTQVAFLIGKLEHWGWVSRVTGSAEAASNRSAGRGTARQAISSIKANSIFGATDIGEAAFELWPRVIDEVEARWQRRLGSSLTAALKLLSTVSSACGVLMPEGLPPMSANRMMIAEWRQFPAGTLQQPRSARVPVLLARGLLAAMIAYEQISTVPLALAANTLRVVEEGGTPISKLHERSGTSPETAASQCTALSQLGLAEIVKDSTNRGRLLRPTPAGTKAQEAHARITKDAEAAIDPGGEAAGAMGALLGRVHKGELAIRAALTPPPGVRRSGTPWAVGIDLPSVKTRDREVVTQTEAFLADPFRALPHFPVWEATRAFGP